MGPAFQDLLSDALHKVQHSVLATKALTETKLLLKEGFTTLQKLCHLLQEQAVKNLTRCTLQGNRAVVLPEGWIRALWDRLNNAPLP